MLAQFLPLACTLALAQPLERAQPIERSDWLLAPRFNQGLELVYRGTVTLEALGQGTRFAHCYQLENRIFVLDKSAHGLEVALFTTYKSGVPGKPENRSEVPSVRLEVASVDSRGR